MGRRGRFNARTARTVHCVRLRRRYKLARHCTLVEFGMQFSETPRGRSGALVLHERHAGNVVGDRERVAVGSNQRMRGPHVARFDADCRRCRCDELSFRRRWCEFCRGIFGGVSGICDTAGRRSACVLLWHERIGVRTDLPPEQRFGAIAQWQQLPYLSIAACGDAIFAVDHNGCVSAAPDNIETAFSVGVLRYVEQFAWPCAADQRVFVSLSCTIR